MVSNVLLSERLLRAGRELWQDGRGWILVAISAGWLLSLGTRLVYPAILPYLQADFGLDLSTAGLLLTLLWGAYALGQFPGGLLGDAIGERNVLVLSTLGGSVTLLVVTTAVSVEMLFLGSIVFGFATALYGPTRFTVFSDIYSARMGTAIGLSMSAGNLGNTLLPITAVLVATYLTWRVSFAALVPLFFIVSIVLWFLIPKRTSSSRGDSSSLVVTSPREILSGLAQGAIPLVLSIQISMAFVYQGFVGFYPTYLIEVKGLSPGLAAALFSVFFAVGMLAQPLAGASLDRFGPRLSLTPTLGIIMGSLLVLHLANGLVQLVLITIILSTITGYGAITQTFLADMIPDSMTGTGLGLLRSGWILIGATSPVLIGILGDYGYLSEAFIGLGAVTFIALVLSLFAPRSR